ncbi:MAG: histone deacetylase [Bdellovibrionales bacterium]|nr:histone deacetylase [Bdellovibrionales bacterium]
MSTALVLDPVFARHPTGAGHPERPERITAIEAALETAGLIARCMEVQPHPVAERWLLSNHSEEYLSRLARACEMGLPYIDSPDSTIGEDSLQVAQLAAGSAVEVVRRVLQGEARNGFAALRPPGHHAEYDCSLGFCLLNNVAIAARYALAEHGLSRIFIFDWDVHHGNGTQHSFESMSEVFYCSMHAHPATLFPGTGFAEERGQGKGEGYTLNLPLLPGTSGEEAERLLVKHVLPAIASYRPELILLSAGFDAHIADPIGNQRFSTETFVQFTKRILEAAEGSAGGRVVSLLEGGYDLPALAECVSAHVTTLVDC